MSKDAEATRLLLVQAARRRFAFDGYRATTVRDIAADAGVNVALINRYFVSKEGLFRACLDRVVRDLDAEERATPDLERALRDLIAHVVQSPTDEDSIQLMVLLRSSGDEGADAIRRETLRHYAERLAGVVGGEVTDELLVRAEVALAVVLGMTMLRTSTQVEPLASAEHAVVARALEDALRGLFDLADEGSSAR
ncbi:TetR/AcrR family transcriptional regulator [Curtobacterium pusillum]|uniref:AcrR family transcriptional regulator n=1 Tax=Curtobacterium pusillum TaxID=69373 RepID=A0AAW3T8C5_9MICO|nr:TetR/AcrR family transcriptional regulator [Curtobacterium pusillum]MBA8991207.1 AcrR family transcriptional regulator [Curtobacterium pusillum]NUU15320.1 TetR/AcrR family transcriptional regulator [Curtobacterium pusillum]GLK31346.1 TetR family transcriptional regulator [Curtobacterium pusillum]